MPNQWEKIDPVERFHSKYFKEPNSGCWLWTSDVDEKGYGRFHHNKKRTPAHRYSWVLENGPIQEGSIICHKCDTPACVNPHHLFLGTSRDNTRDMISKGRDFRPNQKGDGHGCAKLSSKDIPSIRLDPRTHKEIAMEYRVSESAICGVKTGRYWRHI